MSTYAYLKNKRNNPTWLMEQMSELDFNRIDATFIDTDTQLTEYYRMLNQLVEADTVVMYSLATLVLSQNELAKLIQTFMALNIRLILSHDAIDTAETNYHSFYRMFLCFQETVIPSSENSVNPLPIHEIFNKTVMGRPTITPTKAKEIAYYRKQKKSIREIALICNVSIGTVHKYLNAS